MISKKSKATLALVALSSAQVGMTATLGAWSNYSFLGEPLHAWVEVIASDHEDLSRAKVKVAEASVYEAAGLKRPQGADFWNLKLVKKEHQKWSVIIRSGTPIQDAAMTVLLQIELDGKVDSKKYALLLDLRDQSESAMSMEDSQIALREQKVREFSDQDSQEAKVQVELPRAATKKKIQKQKSDILQESESISGEVRVKRGDVLSALAKQYTPDDAHINQTMEAFVEKNPKAFVNQNPNWLKQGVLMEIPSPQEIRNKNKKKAAQWMREQVAQFEAMQKTPRSNKASVQGKVQEEVSPVKVESLNEKTLSKSEKSVVLESAKGSEDTVAVIAGKKAQQELEDKIKQLKAMKMELERLTQEEHERAREKQLQAAKTPQEQHEQERLNSERSVRGSVEEESKGEALDSGSKKPSKNSENPLWIENIEAPASQASEGSLGAIVQESASAASEGVVVKVPAEVKKEDITKEPHVIETKPVLIQEPQESSNWMEKLPLLGGIGLSLGAGLAALWAVRRKKKQTLMASSTLNQVEVKSAQDLVEPNLKNVMQEKLDAIDTLCAFHKFDQAQETLMQAQQEWGDREPELVKRLGLIQKERKDFEGLKQTIESAQKNDIGGNTISVMKNWLQELEQEMDSNVQESSWDENRVDQGFDLEQELTTETVRQDTEGSTNKKDNEYELSLDFDAPESRQENEIDFNSKEIKDRNLKVEQEVEEDRKDLQESLGSQEWQSPISESLELAGEENQGMGDLNLEDFSFTPEEIEMKTMLELAQSYIEMDSWPDAEGLLNEIIEKSSSEILVKKAKEMKDRHQP